MKAIELHAIRVQLLCTDILHIELAKNGKFCDEDTFFIPDKAQWNPQNLPIDSDGCIAVEPYVLKIPGEESLVGLTVSENGRQIYCLENTANTGELPPPADTPAVFAVWDNPRIFIPQGGYSPNAKGAYRVEENTQDVYLLLCGGDPKKLRRLYTTLTGKCEMVRLATLGSWNSKYFAYDEESARQLILDYEAHDIPLDVMVLDTDWRKSDGGSGYEINTQLFPDMGRFLDFAHSHGVEIMFNDHPEPKNGCHVFEPEEIAFREENMTRLLDMGLDMWWYDRNWWTHLISPTDGVASETLGLYLFHDITKNHHIRCSTEKNTYRRPVIMGNVSNIANGEYDTIGDSASHRYSIQWTGDISSDLGDISREVESMLRCGDNCIGYCSADLGGHVGNPDKETFIRWMQFGALSPILRPHCSNQVKRTREPWCYDSQTEDICREYIKLRYRLLPVIYRAAFENYRDGAPIFASTHFRHPQCHRQQKLNGQYMLGDNILIAPIGGENPRDLDEVHYTSPVKATYYDGIKHLGEPLAIAEYKKLLKVWKHDIPEPGVPPYNFSAVFETTVQFPQSVELFIVNDDGATVYLDGEKVLEDDAMHGPIMSSLGKLEQDRQYRVRVEYFQGGGLASCRLCWLPANLKQGKEVFLPAGQWLDVFTGEIHTDRLWSDPGLAQMPLFVRLGSLIPLAANAHNTAAQRWDKLLLDYYPHREAEDRGYLYEDDGCTTAYQQGQYRTCAYEAFFDGTDTYQIILHPAQGDFEGDRFVKTRDITLKIHELSGKRVRKVTVNGQCYPVTHREKQQTFPLSWEEGASDADVALVRFRQEVHKAYNIQININD